MNTEWLQEYIVFARHLNFSSAAKTLNMAQPTLSKHMIALENGWGFLSLKEAAAPSSPIMATAFLSALNQLSPH